MANEIQVQCALSFTKAGLAASYTFPSTSFNMTGSNYSAGSLTTSNSSVTAIPLALIGTPGWLIIHNRDATNSVNFYPTSGGVASTTIPPEGVTIIYCDGASPSVKAVAGTPIIDYLLLEA